MHYKNKSVGSFLYYIYITLLLYYNLYHCYISFISFDTVAKKSVSTLFYYVIITYNKMIFIKFIKNIIYKISIFLGSNVDPLIIFIFSTSREVLKMCIAKK